MVLNPDDFVTSDFPAEHEQYDGWEIRRTPEKAALQLCLISSVPLTVATHYFMGRTTAHLRADCPACARHHIPRTYSYVLAIDCKDQKPIIFECPRAAGLQLKVFTLEHQTLRGLLVTAIRPKAKANGKVVLSTRGPFRKGPPLPAEIPILPILLHIWGLDEDSPAKHEEFTEYALTEEERVEARAKLVPPAGRASFNGRNAVDLDLRRRGEQERNGEGPIAIGDVINNAGDNGHAGKQNF